MASPEDFYPLNDENEFTELEEQSEQDPQHYTVGRVSHLIHSFEHSPSKEITEHEMQETLDGEETVGETIDRENTVGELVTMFDSPERGNGTGEQQSGSLVQAPMMSPSRDFMSLLEQSSQQPMDDTDFSKRQSLETQFPMDSMSDSDIRIRQSLSQHLMEDSENVSADQFSQHLMSVTSSGAWMALSQHPMALSQNPMGVSQHPMGLSQHPMALSQHPMGLSQHPMQDSTQATPMSAGQHHFSDLQSPTDVVVSDPYQNQSQRESFITVRDRKSSESRGSRDGHLSSGSGESSDHMAIFSTRPGTAVELADLDGGGFGRRDDKSNIARLSDASADISAGVVVEDVHAQNASSCQFRHSIQFQHGHGQSSLGDTLLHGQKEPVWSSTPAVQSHMKSNHLSDNKPSSGKLIPLDGSLTAPSEDFAATAEMYYPIHSISGELDMESRGTSRASSTGSQDRIFIADGGIFSEGKTTNGASASDHIAERQKTSTYDLYSPDNRPQNLVVGNNDNSSLVADSISLTDDVVVVNLSNATGDTDSLTMASAGFVESIDDLSNVARDNLSNAPLDDLSSNAQIDLSSNVPDDLSSARGDDLSSALGADRSSLTMVTDMELASLGSREASYPPDVTGVSEPADSVHSVDASSGKNHSEKSQRNSGSESSLSDRVAAILSQMPSQAVDSDAELGSNEQQRGMLVKEGDENSDEEIERITGEYRQVLKERLVAFSDTDSNVSGMEGKMSSVQSPGNEIDTSSKSLSHSETQTSPHVPYDQIEITTTTSQNGTMTYSAHSSQRRLSRGSDSGTDDTLDQDVKKILAKYGRTLSDSEDDHVRRPLRNKRASTADSGDETDDMKRWVSGMLYGKPGDDELDTLSPQVTGSNIPTYLFDDPAKSMSLPMELRTTSHESIPTAVEPQKSNAKNGKSNLVHEPIPKVFLSSISDDGSSVSDDQLSSKVLQLLKDTRYSDAAQAGGSTKTASHSKGSSRTSSVAGSVDLDNLEREIDEMEVNLKKTKEFVHKRSRLSSDRSQASEKSQISDRSQGHATGSLAGDSNGYDRSTHAELSQHSWRSQGTEASQPGDRFEHLEQIQDSDRSLLSEQSLQADVRFQGNETSQFSERSQNVDASENSENFHDYRHTQVDNLLEMDNSSSYRSVPGVDEHDESLHKDHQNQEIITDSVEMSPTVDQLEDRRAFEDRGRDNEDIEQDANSERIPSEYIRSKYRTDDSKTVNKPDLGVHALLTSGVIPLDIALDIVHGYPVASRRSGDSFHSLKSPGSGIYGDYGNVSPQHYDIDRHGVARKMVRDGRNVMDHDASLRSTSGYVLDPGSSLDARSPYVTSAASANLRDTMLQQPAETSANYETSPLARSGITPESYTPLRAFGNVRSLFTSHMDKVTQSAFDRSIELNAPYRHNLDPHANNDVMRKYGEHLEASDRVGRDSKSYPGDRMLGAAYIPGERGPGSAARSRSDVPDYQNRRPIDTTSYTKISAPSTSTLLTNTRSTAITDQADVQDSRTTHRSVSPLTAGLRPYKPVSGQEMYYVESGTDDGQSTVVMSESTIESTHLGSDDARGPHFPSSALGTRYDDSNGAEGIYHKQKTTSDDPGLTTIQEQPSFDSRDAESGKSKSDESVRSKKDEEKERSLVKARDWVTDAYQGDTQETPKATPRDNLGQEVLQDQIQPHDAIDGGRPTSEQTHAKKYLHDSTGELEDTASFGTPKKSQEKSRGSQYNSTKSSPYYQSAYGYTTDSFGAGTLMEDNDSVAWEKYKTPTSPGHGLPRSEYDPAARVIDHGLPRPEYDPAARVIDYGRLQYSQDTNTYQLSPTPIGAESLTNNYNINQNSDDSFLPLESDQDQDEDTTHKLYPATPYPLGSGFPDGTSKSSGHDMKVHLSDSTLLDARLPTKYFLSDGRVIIRSPNASGPLQEQSVLSDQLGVGTRPGYDQSIEGPDGQETSETSPLRYGRELQAISMGKYPIGREVREGIRSEGVNSGSLSPHRASHQTYGVSGRPHSPQRVPDISDRLSPSRHPQSPQHVSDISDRLSPSRRLRDNYSEDRLQQRMQYMMARLGPEMDNLPADINNKWDRFLQTRSQSDANSSGRSADFDDSTIPMTKPSSLKPHLNGSTEPSHVINSQQKRIGSNVENNQVPRLSNGFDSSAMDTVPAGNRYAPIMNSTAHSGLGANKIDRSVGNSTHSASDRHDGDKYGAAMIGEDISQIETPDLLPHLHTSSAYEEQDTEELLQPHLSHDEESQPHLLRGEVPQPHMSHDEVPQPHLSHAKVPQSHLSHAKGPQPHLSRGEVPQPHLSHAKVPQPHLSSGEVPQSHLSHAEVSQPHLSHGEASQPRRSHLPQPGTLNGVRTQDTLPNAKQHRQPESRHVPTSQAQDDVKLKQKQAVEADVRENDALYRSTLQSSGEVTYRPLLTTQETQTSDQEDTVRVPPSVDNSDRRKRNVLISEENSEQLRHSEAKKTAYLIKDETLASVPEDSTLDSISSDFTTSSYESDGKIILKTTKRHLPDDPKLLRLQHKILKQKDKYKHERLRELKRKEKIVTMERQLAEQNLKLDGSKVVRLSRSGDVLVSTVRSPKKSSTPSARKHISWSSSSDSTVVSVSDITSSTLTESSFMSEDLTLTEAKDTSPERSAHDHSTQISMDTSHICTCQNRENRKNKTAEKPARTSISPSRRKSKEPHHAAHTDRPQDSYDYSMRSGRPRSGLYMEFDKPASKSVSRTRAPQRSRRDKENANAKERKTQHKHHKEQQNERKQQAVKSSQVSNRSIGMKDFGQTCPSPITVSDKHTELEQLINTANKATKAVQTQKLTDPLELSHTTQLILPPEKNNTLSARRTVEFVKNERRSHGGDKDRLEFGAGKCGLTWYVPMGEPRPWRKPLLERQAYAVAMDTSPDMLIMSGKHRSYDISERHRVTAYGDSFNTLQTAFEDHMQNFISRSHERQRLVALRAEERYIEDLHNAQRDKLFAVKRKIEANVNAHPICGQHFQPQKRSFNRKQMIEQTKKLYSELPEVKQQAEDKKKEEKYKTNRLKARLFKQKVQYKVLNKRAGWVQ